MRITDMNDWEKYHKSIKTIKIKNNYMSFEHNKRKNFDLFRHLLKF